MMSKFILLVSSVICQLITFTKEENATEEDVCDDEYYRCDFSMTNHYAIASVQFNKALTSVSIVFNIFLTLKDKKKNTICEACIKRLHREYKMSRTNKDMVVSSNNENFYKITPLQTVHTLIYSKQNSLNYGILEKFPTKNLEIYHVSVTNNLYFANTFDTTTDLTEIDPTKIKIKRFKIKKNLRLKQPFFDRKIKILLKAIGLIIAFAFIITIAYYKYYRLF